MTFTIDYFGLDSVHLDMICLLLANGSAKLFPPKVIPNIRKLFKTVSDTGPDAHCPQAIRTRLAQRCLDGCSVEWRCYLTCFRPLLRRFCFFALLSGTKCKRCVMETYHRVSVEGHFLHHDSWLTWVLQFTVVTISWISSRVLIDFGQIFKYDGAVLQIKIHRNPSQTDRSHRAVSLCGYFSK